MVDKARASHVLDELGIPALDPMRGTLLDFAQRPLDEQVLHFVVGQNKIAQKVEELEDRFDDHDRRKITKERFINGATTFGMLAAYVAYAAMGSPQPPWPD